MVSLFLPPSREKSFSGFFVWTSTNGPNDLLLTLECVHHVRTANSLKSYSL
jgi:hypothetical protein